MKVRVIELYLHVKRESIQMQQLQLLLNLFRYSLHTKIKEALCSTFVIKKKLPMKHCQYVRCKNKQWFTVSHLPDQIQPLESLQTPAEPNQYLVYVRHQNISTLAVK